MIKRYLDIEGLVEQWKLTIDIKGDSLADCWRHVIAGDAEVDPHLSPVHLPERHCTAVVRLNYRESEIICLQLKGILIKSNMRLFHIKLVF